MTHWWCILGRTSCGPGGAPSPGRLEQAHRKEDATTGLLLRTGRDVVHRHAARAQRERRRSWHCGQGIRLVTGSVAMPSVWRESLSRGPHHWDRGVTEEGKHTARTLWARLR